MNEEQKNALESSLHDICKDLDADEILPYLRSKQVIQRGQVQEIMKITSKLRQNMQLIDFITEAGPSAFQEFINALQTCNKEDLAKKILAHLPSSSTQQSMISEMSTTNRFASYNHGGSNMNGAMTGGNIVQRDQHIHFHNTSQAPSTFPSNSSQPSTEVWQKKLVTAQQSLKEMYLTRFRKVYPFSFPFTFDIENTWVSLALKDDLKNSQATEDHVELLQKAFERAKMLIIEGNPATGKTSLMRRLAYEWANGKQELLLYDLLIYTEFREVRENTFQSIADLVLCYSKNYLTKEGYKNLKKLSYNEQFCKEYCILVLLDGYDESSLEKQCYELNSYIMKETINKQLFFNTVITTRKGHLSNFREREGRFVFAEVLGFTTMQQKEKYVYNHFLSSEFENKRKSAAVRSLIKNNNNLNKLAETPLFLTFICLVYERIVDGTLLELYCNIIWWLIDRHQQYFPDRDIPALFGFQNGSNDKFEIIQDHYLHFPQLRCLGKMALHNLKRDVFKPSDFEQFSLQPILEQVGLLRKEKKYDNFKLVTSFFFPHRTIQEFLAAFHCFCAEDPTSEWLLPDSQFEISGMNEFERFLFRIALSDKMPIQTEKRKYYFERITETERNMTAFDAFNTTAGFNNELLNWFLSQCTNVQNIRLGGKLKGARYARNMLNDISVHSGSTITSKIYYPTLSFSDLTKLHSLAFDVCIFQASFKLLFTNCSSLKNVKFLGCRIESGTLSFAELSALDTVELEKSTFQADSQLSFTNCPSLKNLKFHGCEIKSSANLSFAGLSATEILSFDKCELEANSQLSFTNCLSLKRLKISGCEISSSTNLGIATWPAIGTAEFDGCKINFETWQYISDAIRYRSVKYLQLTFGEDFNEEILIHLQNCSNVEKIEITIQIYTIRQNDLLSLNNLVNLHLMIFWRCIFEANSQLSFTNCPSLKNLQFHQCKIESSTIPIAPLPAINIVGFYNCKISLATWQSITEQIWDSSVKCLKLSADYFVEETYPLFLYHLQKCERIEQVHVKVDLDSNGDFIFDRYEEEVTANLVQAAQNLPRLTSITIFDGKLKERNREQIKKAGRKRYPRFSIKYRKMPVQSRKCQQM